MSRRWTNCFLSPKKKRPRQSYCQNG